MAPPRIFLSQLILTLGDSRREKVTDGPTVWSTSLGMTLPRARATRVPILLALFCGLTACGDDGSGRVGPVSTAGPVGGVVDPSLIAPPSDAGSPRGSGEVDAGVPADSGDGAGDDGDAARD